MRPLTTCFALLASALVPFSSAAPGQSAELAVIVNPSSPVLRLEATELEAIFTSVRRSWSGGDAIVAFSYPPDHALRLEFDGVVLRLTPSEVGRFWVDQRIRADRRPPRQVSEPSLALRLVARMGGGIAYVPAGLVTPDVRVVARIRNGEVVGP